MMNAEDESRAQFQNEMVSLMTMMNVENENRA
jgi:hypothetical protein